MKPVFTLVWAVLSVCLAISCSGQSTHDAAPQAASQVAIGTNEPWFARILAEPLSEEADDDATFIVPADLTRETALKLLLSTHTFADDAIGDGGDLSGQVAAYRIILKQPDAIAVFNHLLRKAQPAGKLYALCGLYLLDRPAFDRAVQPFRGDAGEVRIQFGCSGGRETVRSIVESEAPCALRLSPGQTPEEWRRRTGCDSYHIDILGGGYAWEFREP